MWLPLSLLSLLPVLAAGGGIPNYGGLNVIWSESFTGSAGSGVDQGKWNVADVKMNNNGELETYTASSRNLQISGGGTVQLVPWRDGNGWTSGRIETKDSFTPEPGRLTRIEAAMRLGNHPPWNKAGIWPAFWLMGDAVRHGTPWPWCGELDIMEQRNGEAVAVGTVHCGQDSGGICNEPSGRSVTTALPDDGFHTWAIQWDRRTGSWWDESITWLRDGQPFNTLRGADIGDEGIWATLAHMPYYILLNVAVGGAFPGGPNGQTMDGYGAMLEVQYVAVYRS